MQLNNKPDQNNAPTAPALHPWDQAAAEEMCRRIVRARRHFFAAFRYVSQEDLTQIALEGALLMHWKQKEAAGCSYMTWIGIGASRRLIDEWRRMEGSRRRFNKVARGPSAEEWAREVEGVVPTATLLDKSPRRRLTPEIPLCVQPGAVTNLPENSPDFSTDEITLATTSLPPFPWRFGPHRHTLPQLALCLLLQSRYRTSLRGTVQLLEQNPDTLRQIGLHRPPSRMALHRAKRTLRRVMCANKSK